jgi:hypothetical protein
MDITFLRQQLIEEANRCNDADRLQRALSVFVNLNGNHNAMANSASNGVDTSGGSGSMSREEFMRRLRGNG